MCSCLGFQTFPYPPCILTRAVPFQTCDCETRLCWLAVRFVLGVSLPLAGVIRFVVCPPVPLTGACPQRIFCSCVAQPGGGLRPDTQFHNILATLLGERPKRGWAEIDDQRLCFQLWFDIFVGAVVAWTRMRGYVRIHASRFPAATNMRCNALAREAAIFV